MGLGSISWAKSLSILEEAYRDGAFHVVGRLGVSYMNYSLNSLKGGLYRGLYGGLL